MANNQIVAGARYSAINAADSCKRSAWLTYSQNKKGYKNPYAKLGIIIHEALEDYGNHCLSKKIGTDYDYYELVINKSLTKADESIIGDLRQILNNIKDTTNFEELLDYPVVDIEKRIALNEYLDYDDLSQYYSGGIDLLYIDHENRLNIEDYKSVRKIYTNSYMKESLQRKAYAYLAYQKYKDLYKFESIRFRFNFVRYGYLSDWFESSIEEIERDYKQLLQDKIKDHYHLMNEKDPPEATPSGFCILCENKGLCDEYENAFSIEERIESQDDAVNLINHYRLAKLKIDSVETMLKEYVNVNGPIKLGKEEWGPHVSPGLKFNDVNLVFDELTKLKVPKGAIMDALSTNKTNINKILKKFKIDNKISNAFLEKTASKNFKTTFKFTSIEEDEEVTDNVSTELLDPYF